MTPRQSKQSNQGFTLIETLVAVTILVIGVIGPLGVAVRGISDGLYVQNQLMARALAEEAIETVVNLRDGNVLRGKRGLAVFDGLGNGEDWIRSSVNAATGQVEPDECSGNGCYLSYSESSGYYVESASGPFQRRVDINNIFEGGDIVGKKITTTVRWKNKAVNKQLTLVGYIYVE